MTDEDESDIVRKDLTTGVYVKRAQTSDSLPTAPTSREVYAELRKRADETRAMFPQKPAVIVARIATIDALARQMHDLRAAFAAKKTALIGLICLHVTGFDGTIYILQFGLNGNVRLTGLARTDSTEPATRVKGLGDQDGQYVPDDIAQLAWAAATGGC